MTLTITKPLLRKIAGRRATDKRLTELADAMNRHFPEYGITTVLRASHFFGQMIVESGGFTVFRENMNYSATRLLQVFPRHFTTAQARAYAGKPKKIASYVYGNRGGNGAEQSGDGYRYRGAGIIHLTFKANYRKFGQAVGVDLVANPEKAAQSDIAVRVALAFWKDLNLNHYADADEVDDVTRRINGGYNGLQERIKQTMRVRRILLNGVPAQGPGPHAAMLRRKTKGPAVEALQSRLKELGYPVGAIDGDFGSKTEKAVKHFQRMHGLTPDGIVGPATNAKLANVEISGRDDPSPIRETPKGPAVFPRQRDVPQFYGARGQNQRRIRLPFKMRLAWDLSKSVSRVPMHEKCADSAERIFKRIHEHYGDDEIKRLGIDLLGGTLNVRRIRGGAGWSMHSWGIAIDFDPAHNQLRWGRDRARFAQPEYEQFWKFWEEEGWLSLGRSRNFDWMHVQAARL